VSRIVSITLTSDGKHEIILFLKISKNFNSTK